MFLSWHKDIQDQMVDLHQDLQDSNLSSTDGSPDHMYLRLEEFNDALDVAIQSYQKGKEGIGPWMIGDNVSKCQFELWSSKVESRWKLAFEWIDSHELGHILFYGDPGRVHATASAWFCIEIISQLRSRWPNRMELRRMQNAGDVQVELKNKEKTCDFSLQSRYTKSACPPLVGEVAHMNESKVVLKQELQWWTTSDNHALMAIGIKIFVSQAKNNSKYHLTYYEKWRGNPIIKDIRFGPQYCKVPKDTRFAIQIPIRVLVEGDKVLCAAISDIKDEFVQLDLYDLQECILAADCLEKKKTQ